MSLLNGVAAKSHMGNILGGNSGNGAEVSTIGIKKTNGAVSKVAYMGPSIGKLLNGGNSAPTTDASAIRA